MRQQKVRQLNVTSVLCNRHLDTSLKCRAVVFLMALLPVIEANSPERLHVTVIIRTQFAPYPLTSCLLLHSSTVLVMSVIGRVHIIDMNSYNLHRGLKFVQLDIYGCHHFATRVRIPIVPYQSLFKRISKTHQLQNLQLKLDTIIPAPLFQDPSDTA